MAITSTSFIYAVSTIFLGSLSPLETYTSIHGGTDLYDTKQPMISLGVQHDIYNKITLFFEHQSSPVTLEDRGLDHVGFKYKFNKNFYAGSSIQVNSCKDCSKQLVVTGYEMKNLFVEYCNQRVYTGLKFTF